MSRIKVILLGAALPLLFTACGSAPSGDDGVASAAGAPSSAPTASAAVSDDPYKFAQCMRDNGVDMPDPKVDGDKTRISVNGDGMSDDQMDAAMKACEKFSPIMGGDGSPPDPAVQKAALKWAQCMRDNGVDMPDPKVDGKGIRISAPKKLDSATMKKAEEKCEQLQPKPSGRPE